MRLTSVAIALILGSAPASLAAQPEAQSAAADDVVVIREAIHAEPAALSPPKDRGSKAWRKREAREDMREALEEAIEMARSAEGF